MNNTHGTISNVLRANWKILVSILFAGVITAGIVVGALYVFATPQYSSRIQLLIVQRYTLTDSYTAAKSAERVATNLTEVVGTSTFFDRVVQTQWADLSELEALSEEEKRKEWKKKLEAQALTGSSVLQLTAYDEDPEEAERLAQAAATVLLEDGANYHGAPDTVSLRVVDYALTSEKPVKPGYVNSGIMGFIFGIVLAIIAVFFSPRVHFDISSLRHKNSFVESHTAVIDSVAPLNSVESPMLHAMHSEHAVDDLPRVEVPAVAKTYRKQRRTKRLEQKQQQEELRKESEMHQETMDMPAIQYKVLHVQNYSKELSSEQIHSHEKGTIHSMPLRAQHAA